MLISHIAEEVYLLFFGEEPNGYAVNWSISPSLQALISAIR
jgi:hypothetical protein